MNVFSKAKFLLLAHDLSDAGIARRAHMLTAGGGAVVVAGFRRTENPVLSVGGYGTVDFGRTHNAGFMQRAWSVFRLLFLLGRYRNVFSQAEIIVARNLEMLALAVWGQWRFNRSACIVYEVLDIHRLLLRKDLIGVCLRGVEGFLSSFAQGVLTSSPAFIEHYFKPLSRVRVPFILVENKVLYSESSPTGSPCVEMVKKAPPWSIGWFGMIRCRKSLEILIRLVRACEGRVEVVIRGKPALDQIKDFSELVSSTKGLKFLGAYSNPQDLETIYSDVHFTWAIDKFEEGLNSSWLLPNRLYEGGLYGAIPIAQTGVETGRFIRTLGIGLTLTEPEEDRLKVFFDELTQDKYLSMKKAALAVPRSTWMQSATEGAELVSRLIVIAEKNRNAGLNDERS